MLYYVTGNSVKFRSAKTELEPFNIEIEQKELDIVEIQSENIEEIAKDKAQKAFVAVGQSLIVNDSAWYIPALNGFPGPFMKYVNDWFVPEDFLHLMAEKSDKSVILKQVVVYIDEYGQKVFKSEHKGMFLDKPSNVDGKSGDRVITFSEDGISIAENNAYNSFKIESNLWKDFADWYKEQ